MVLQVRGTTTEPVFSLWVNGESPDYPDESTFETNFTNLIAPEDITGGVASADGSSLTYTVAVAVTEVDGR